MPTEISQLEQTMKDVIRKSSHKAQATLSPHKSKPEINASTHLETGEIIMGYNKEYEQETLKSPLRVIRDGTRHELLHHRTRIQDRDYVGVPGDVDTSRTCFFEPIYSVLHEKGFSEQDALYVENALEDTLLHLDGSRDFSFQGIVDFFDNVGRNSGKPSQDRATNPQLRDAREYNKFTPFYEAHVKLNMLLWGNSQQKSQMRKRYSYSEKASKALAEFISRTKMASNGINSSEELREYFLDKTNWPEISRIYAETFSQLIEPGFALPTMNHSGAGTKGRERQTPNPEEGNVFQRQRNTDEYIQKVVREGHESRTGVPSWLETTKQDKMRNLRLLYESFVRSLNIKLETRTRAETLPIATITRKPFDPITDDFEGIEVETEDGRTRLYVPQTSVVIPISIKTGERGFPRIRYANIDTSESMLDAIDGSDVGNTSVIPWGDNSKYHFALLTWQGFVNYLIRNGLLRNKKDIELFNFSERTIHGKGLDQAMEVAFSPQFKGTSLSKNAVKTMFSGEDNLIFTISDGAISNWEDIKTSFFEGAIKNHYFHLQIGDMPSQAQEMIQRGLRVFPVYNFKDLYGRVIDLTRRIRTEQVPARRRK